MIELYDVEKVRAAEKSLTDGGETVLSLMKRAGDGLFEKLNKIDYNKVFIFVGKGNNGGDGFAVACNYLDADKSVTVVCVSDGLSDASRYYRDRYLAGGGKVVDFSESLIIENALIVDCIFGVGFHGVPTGREALAIRFLNDIKVKNNYVVSVDIPSGLNGDSGLYGSAVEADETLVVGCVKTGLILNAAKDCVGKISVIDIGIEPKDPCAFLVGTDDLRPILRQRKHFSHKNDYGTVGVMGGSVNYGGAAKLANTSLCALLSGAGLSRLIVPERLTDAVAPYILESTLTTIKSDDYCAVFDASNIDAAIKGLDALSVGMGMGNTEETYKIIEYIIKNKDLKLCIDADGLNAISKNVDILKTKRTYKTVLTPHVGEFCRLSGYSPQDVLSDPISKAKAFAKGYDVILLLKGTATIVTDGETVLVTDTGTAGMATAGSGDVLSGVIAGLLGYNEPSVLSVAAASYIVGYAAQIARKHVCDISHTASVTARFVPEAVTAIYNELYS